MKLRNGSPEEAGISEQRIAALDAFADRMFAENITPAQAYVAARKGVIVAHRAVGKLTPEADSPPLDVNALFPLCSITKIFTAAAIMILVENGLIGLNRPVADYIPEFQGEGKDAVRVHHLLTHTSGIRPEDLWEYKRKVAAEAVIPPCEENENPEIHREIYLGCGVPLARKPGEVMAYLGFGYELLGDIVRRISGLSYPEFMKRNLFEPLGMKDTFYNVPHSERYRIVRRSPEDACAGWLENDSCIESESAGGGLYSTAMDVAIFAQMFLNQGEYDGKRILSPVSVREMTRNHIPGVASEYRDEYFPEAYWGYGWSINGTKKDGGDLFSPEAYSHWGAAGVFVAVDPVCDVVSVYFTVERDLQKPFKNMYTDHFNNVLLAAIEKL
ncbi:serine hydrolase domain-containing protein [Paenibacillus alkalitolerans]|uniref:serine hydrolase domain-containing protein n=1 Tax=Paenibacillus alkalitolerans TaxID=2799335 RepID=UPI0018F40CCE|nr:serine hydrolase domain-containing protein [Paenibacillus alkalitolerans]